MWLVGHAGENAPQAVKVTQVPVRFEYPSKSLMVGPPYYGSIPVPLQGVNPKFVQELLGHADIGTTLNVYSHVLPDMGDAAAGAMDDALG